MTSKAPQTIVRSTLEQREYMKEAAEVLGFLSVNQMIRVAVGRYISERVAFEKDPFKYLYRESD